MSKPIIIAIITTSLLAVGGATVAGFYIGSKNAKPTATPTSTASTAATTNTDSTTGLTLDPNKNYGNKYKNGILPVGDNKYSTSQAKKGSIYVCNANFVPASQAGAQTRGPWFISNTEWDITKKIAVQGKVDWDQQFSMKMESGKRNITTNDLPDHHTGVFPVQSSDPARAYDANPNKIQSQSLSYSLNAAPKYGEPQCMSGEVGIMMTGVAMYNGFDAGGRDAGAWEVQDSCDGHPQNKGAYHYHSLSRCIEDVSVSAVIGFALDGYPITGPKVGEENFLTTDDLDECHGITSQITLDGKPTTTYHYVMTKDFPYSVSCFRSQAIKAPGLPENSGGQSNQQTQPSSQPGQMPPPPPRQ